MNLFKGKRLSVVAHGVATMVAVSVVIWPFAMAAGCGGGGASSSINEVKDGNVRFAVAKATENFTVAAVNNLGSKEDRQFTVDVPAGAKSLMMLTEGQNAELVDAQVQVKPQDAGRATPFSLTMADKNVSTIGGTLLKSTDTKVADGVNVVLPKTEAKSTSQASEEGCTECTIEGLSTVVINPQPGKWIINAGKSDIPYVVRIAVVGKDGLSKSANEVQADAQVRQATGTSEPSARGITCNWWWRAGLMWVCRAVIVAGASAVIYLIYQTGLGAIFLRIGTGTVIQIAVSAITRGCPWFTDTICNAIR